MPQKQEPPPPPQRFCLDGECHTDTLTKSTGGTRKRDSGDVARTEEWAQNLPVAHTLVLESKVSLGAVTDGSG